MAKANKSISILLIVALLFVTTVIPVKEAHATPTMPGCKANPSTSVKIFLTSLKTLYNIFPIRIAGVKIMTFAELDAFDYATISSFPVCICKLPPPLFIRVGITFSIWEPYHIFETVQHPWCSPTAGMQLPVPFNIQAVGSQGNYETETSKLATSQVHMIIYPVWLMVGLFLDILCFQYLRSFDFLYFTELDPLWQSDSLASILGPEAVLFANPIARAICVVDAITSTLNRPIDPLFWCMGSWGSTYPMSSSITDTGAYIRSQAGLGAKLVMKLHRQFLLLGTAGPPAVQEWCQRYPLPIWIKSYYNFLLMHPIPLPLRMGVGYPAILWAHAKNPPFIGGDTVWMLYNKRDCCLF